MRRPSPHVVPTLTEVLESPHGAGVPSPAPAILPSEDELRQAVAAAVELAVDELREQLLPRVEMLVREALAQRLKPVHGDD